MIVGVPKEIKSHEYRVGMAPSGVRELVKRDHEVLVQKGSGTAIGLTDQEYCAVGAQLSDAADEIFNKSDLIVKVKEPQASECALLRPGQVLFTFLHLASDPNQTSRLLKSGVVAIAYETVIDAEGRLPLLAPMSEVAGRMSIQAGAHALECVQGGNGTLLGGVPGVLPAKVVILGGGVVGENAVRMALGLGADITLLDRSVSRLRALNSVYGSALKTLVSTSEAVERTVAHADLIIGAVLVPGAVAPKLITAGMLKGLKSGSVLVDVAIDQGGCFETSKPTTHQNPIYSVDGIVHYCVANMPGAVARTSTFALTNVTLPYIIRLADQGYQRVLSEDAGFRQGLNIHCGQVTCKPVADNLGYGYQSPEIALNLKK